MTEVSRFSAIEVSSTIEGWSRMREASKLSWRTNVEALLVVSLCLFDWVIGGAKEELLSGPRVGANER